MSASAAALYGDGITPQASLCVRAHADAACAEPSPVKSMGPGRNAPDEEDRPFLPFSDLRTHGLLWLINRVVFHPRGFALALDVEDDGTVTGWKMLGDGSEVWTFTGDADDEEYAKATRFLDSLRPSPWVQGAVRLSMPSSTPEQIDQFLAALAAELRTRRRPDR